MDTMILRISRSHALKLTASLHISHAGIKMVPSCASTPEEGRTGAFFLTVLPVDTMKRLQVGWLL